MSFTGRGAGMRVFEEEGANREGESGSLTVTIITIAINPRPRLESILFLIIMLADIGITLLTATALCKLESCEINKATI